MCNASWDWTFPEVERSYQIWRPFQKRQFARTAKSLDYAYMIAQICEQFGHSFSADPFAQVFKWKEWWLYYCFDDFNIAFQWHSFLFQAKLDLERGKDFTFTCCIENRFYELKNLNNNYFPYSEQPYNPDSDLMNHGFSCVVVDQCDLYIAGGDIRWIDDEGKEAFKEWIQENNFFKYNFEENKWIKMPAMKPVQYFPDLHVLDGYIYAVGATDYDELSCDPLDYTMQRYNLSTHKWEEVMPEQGLRMNVMSSVLIDGHIMCKGVASYANDEDAGENDVKCYVYIPACTDPNIYSWFKVECSDHIFYDEFSDLLRTINDNCYLLSCKKTYINGENKLWRLCRQGRRLTCDFVSEPAMLTAEVDPTELGVECPYPFKFPKEVYLTFDKRKLGISKEPNKECFYCGLLDHSQSIWLATDLCCLIYINTIIKFSPKNNMFPSRKSRNGFVGCIFLFLIYQ